MNNFAKIPGSLFCICFLISTTSARAAWDISPAAQISTQWSDNVRMSPDSKESALVSTATGQIRLRNVTETSEVSVAAGLSFLKYSYVDGLEDQDIQFLNFSARQKRQRLTFGFTGSYRRDVMLRRSAFISDSGEGFSNSNPIDEGDTPEDFPALNEDPDLDDSLTRIQVRRERIRVSPSFSWRLSERMNTRLGLTYSELNYGQNGTLVGLQDNKNQGVSLSIRRRITDKDSLSLNGSASFFKPGLSPDSQNYVLKAVWGHKTSERSDVRFELGIRRTERDSGLIQNSSRNTGFVFRVRGNRQYENMQIQAVAERSVYPGSFGQLVETDRLTLNLNRDLAERTKFSLSARAFRIDTDSDTPGRNDREYLQISPLVSYRMSPAFTAQFSYEYTWIDRKQINVIDSGTAEGHAVSLAISYTPPRPF